MCEYTILLIAGCGGNVNNLGGGITMMHMVNEGTRMFDCFWIIKPSENFRHRKTHLYLKVNAFSDFGNNFIFSVNNRLL